jgi:hypothetical protein
MIANDTNTTNLNWTKNLQGHLYSYVAPLLVAGLTVIYSLSSVEFAEDNGGWAPSVNSSSVQGQGNELEIAFHAELNAAALTVLYGCTDPNACNFDFYTDCTDLSQLFNDWGGPCEYLDDGSCTYSGCMDLSACNFDAFAGCEDGSCVYPDVVGICGGDCWDDLDQDLICDTEDNCVDITACNFDDANNETCLYADTIYNCGDVCFDPSLLNGLFLEGNLIHGTLLPSQNGAAIGDLSLQVDAFTYGPYATTVIQPTPFTITVLNGLCGNDDFTLLWEHEFCYNALTVLYNGPATFVTESTPEGIDCSGDCLLGGDSNQDGICDFLQTGCGDPAACNFDATALFGGPCDYPEWGFDCSGIYAAGYCGPGTIWDSEQLQCIPVEDSCASDVDGNGVVGINDLLQVLVDYAVICP